MKTRFQLLLLGGLGALFAVFAADARPIRVLVWDEQQPAQRQAYSNFLGNEIVAYLRKQPGLEVASATLNDSEQGLSSAALDRTDVLIWWGHQRHKEITPATGKEIVRRIHAGRLALIALHSAHWSTPFVEAMNARAREDAVRRLSPAERAHAVIVETNRYPNFFTPPKYDALLTPAALYRKSPDGRITISLTLPNCCFPAFRPDGKPSQVRTLLPKHPIARGVPAQFEIPQTEMYDEPFHVPPPDAVIFEERWEPGEWFCSGSVWQIGRGKVFYFRPGHETFPVYKQAPVLKIIGNAVRWAGVAKN
ncbi:MAG: ThuA domain-containing protein [Verrucomicrobia bacterium]|nr:ThuA domain-containing protein [Verrucomicrobiota bacterium]